jgi:hypothetical protein
MRLASPLRFLVLVVAGWVCIRATILLPDWWAPEQAAALPASAARAPPVTRVETPTPRAAAPSLAVVSSETPRLSRSPVQRPPSIASPPDAAAALAARVLPPAAAAAILPLSPPAPSSPRSPGRWSASAWILVRREGGGAALAPGGNLGGSQAGARIAYRPTGGLALSARFYAPARRISGAEIAGGIDWRPSAAFPLNILVERRQRVGREGRSAFSLTLHGGGARALPLGLRAEAYAQAGIVGLRSRDLFIDGAASLAAPLGPIEIGAGAWGAAQPGAARLDAGPSASWRLPVSGAGLRLRADWRFRIAGDAAPGSGPALTLAADF